MIKCVGFISDKRILTPYTGVNVPVNLVLFINVRTQVHIRYAEQYGNALAYILIRNRST